MTKKKSVLLPQFCTRQVNTHTILSPDIYNDRNKFFKYFTQLSFQMYFDKKGLPTNLFSLNSFHTIYPWK